MSKIDTDVLKALPSVGVPADVAEKAAAALCKRDEVITEIKTTLAVHAWMLGLSTTLSVAS